MNNKATPKAEVHRRRASDLRVGDKVRDDDGNEFIVRLAEHDYWQQHFVSVKLYDEDRSRPHMHEVPEAIFFWIDSAWEPYNSYPEPDYDEDEYPGGKYTPGPRFDIFDIAGGDE